MPLSHGLSDEEKEDTSDDFELHFELGNTRNVAVVLIVFFSSQNRIDSELTIL